MDRETQAVICLCGNDGTGKSTLTALLHQKYPQLLVVERSTKPELPALQSLKQEIKTLDLLTYRYAFEKEREIFCPSNTVRVSENIELPVHWIMLDLPPTEIFRRISQRSQMSIYESKKCVEYFSFVYLELAAYYGMTVVDATPSPEVVAEKIVRMIESGATREIRALNVKCISLSEINKRDMAVQLQKELTKETIQEIIKLEIEPELKEKQEYRQFFYPQLDSILYHEGTLDIQLSKKMVGRWILNHSEVANEDNKLFLTFQSGKSSNKIEVLSPSFIHFVEGESKLVYQVRSKIEEVNEYFAQRVWIILKSTIYSHTKQHTGEIEHLGEIRAKGSHLFLEMLRRNNINHAYIAISTQGIIFSRKIQTNGLEIVFKKECIGTDRHSYFGFKKETKLVHHDKQLKCGIYIRFDWRNPNHILQSHPDYVINLHPFYYILEKAVGKQIFFEKFLKKENLRPIGDKCISEDLVKGYVDTFRIKKAALSLYCSFAYYCKRVNLQIIDGCFMFNSDGSFVWSEINADCMRVKRIDTGEKREDYDKDIWRAGGSSSKTKIIEKWNLFNKLLIDYFLQNRFHETQLLNSTPLSYPMNEEALNFLNNKNIELSEEYRSIFTQISVCTQKIKEVIATIDINEGKPTLVKSSQLSEHHSDNNLTHAYRFISPLPKIVIVDLDAALGKANNNRTSIKELRRNVCNNVYGVGGGIRSLEALNFYLNQLSVPRAIISSNLELLDQIPLEIIEDRIIVELSINENNEVLTHGRTVNTKEHITKKMLELSQKGVKVISLTFHHKEGQLKGIPRDQLRDIMFCIPGPIQKVIIAGGISSEEDLEFVWGFPKTIPQLGSAIWKGKISVSALLAKITRFDKAGLCPAIISTQSGKVLGEVFLNEEALKLTAETRQLHRFSRKLNRLIKKGQQSGNCQNVVGIKFDCDHDCLNIMVEESAKPFCHLLGKSCFDFENKDQIESVQALQSHIFRKKSSGSGYSKKMQENEHFSACKFIEESFEFIHTKTRFAEEGADTIAHLLMYLNAKNISIRTIMTELNFRANKVRALEDLAVDRKKGPRQVQYIGIMGSKYFERLDKTILSLLGLHLTRPRNRSLQVQMTVQNKQKYHRFFDGLTVKPIVIKSKDMSLLLAKKEIKWCFNYSIMMENYPKIWKQLIKEPIPAIKLVLKKKEKAVDPFSWTKTNKGKVVSEYPISMISYLHDLGVSEENYTLFPVSGSTEGYLESPLFDYCDAIVQTGRTLQDNNLEIVQVLCDQIYGALYTLDD